MSVLTEIFNGFFFWPGAALLIILVHAALHFYEKARYNNGEKK